eukprot:10851590-Prorocentrum_lima.AAC.1
MCPAVCAVVPQSFAEGNFTSEPRVASARNRARDMPLRSSAEVELRFNLRSRKTRAPPRPI